MYRITAIKKAYKPQANIRLELSWDTFVRFVTMPREINEKKELPLWSPARFISRTELTNQKVETVALAVFDIDEGLWFEAHDSFSDYQYIAHTSFSHTPSKPKWRLIIPFEVPIPRHLWGFVWGKLHKFFEEITNVSMDAACKDARRFYYLPAAGEHYKYHINEKGRTLGYDLETLEIEYRYQREREAELKEERRREKERLADMPDYTRDFRKEFINDLKFERSWRESLGHRIGAKITTDRAVHFTCPRCQRNDATFFYLDPVILWDSNGEAYSVNHKAYCFHKESCGGGRPTQWTLWGLAREMGAG